LTGLIPTLPTLVFKIYHVYIGTTYVVNEENYAMEEECLESEKGGELRTKSESGR
jgi:hypothetical protein